MDPTNEAYKQNEETRQRQMELALLLAAIVDRAVNEFDRLVILMGIEAANAETAAQIEAIIERYLGEIETSVRTQTDTILRGVIYNLNSLYNMDLPALIGNPDVHALAVALMSIVRNRLEGAQELQRLAASGGAAGDAAVLQSTLTSPGLRVQLRKAADYGFASISQAGVYTAGKGQRWRKIAVPVLDNRTTDLCRNRMAWQVREWDEDFVDPETGARWAFPPFVYGGLPRDEAFHFCRTSIAPVITRNA